MAIAALIALGAGSWLFFSRKAHALTDKDTIVLADFENKTGDAVFDDTLRQGLSVQLEQSPFLSLVSDAQIQQTLRLMDHKPDVRLTPAIAREVCQRTGSAAVLDGSIASLGSQYVLGLKAVNCRTGDAVAEEQERASSKEQVLAAMDKAAANLRGKLGNRFPPFKNWIRLWSKPPHLRLRPCKLTAWDEIRWRKGMSPSRVAALQASHTTRPKFRDGLCFAGSRLSPQGGNHTGGGEYAKGLRTA